MAASELRRHAVNSRHSVKARVRLDDDAHRGGQYEEWFPLNVDAVHRWLAGSRASLHPHRQSVVEGGAVGLERGHEAHQDPAVTTAPRKSSSMEPGGRIGMKSPTCASTTGCPAERST